MSADDAKLLRVGEAAKLLGIARSRAYEMASSGTLPGVIRIGRSVRVSQRRLAEWVEAQTAVPGAAEREPQHRPGPGA